MATAVDVSDRKFEYLARLGYAARGLIYVIVGWFALVAAVGGGGGGTPDSEGALREILSQPFGNVLLGIVAVGLIGYALWRAVQAIKDTDHHGTDAKGLAIRGGLLVSAAIHVSLAIFAFSLIFIIGGGGGDSTRDWSATLMRQPLGQWLVGLVGVAVIGAGLAHIVKGYRKGYERYLQMPPRQMERVSPVCMFGLIARGVVFLIIGGFLIVAAWQADPNEARGLAGALRTVQEQPWGWVLLGVVGLGLIAFGIYGGIQAVYRRIDAPEPV
jgi:hypothetical protein